MWGRRRQAGPPPEKGHPSRLRDAIRAARIESAERSGAAVDLRDAELVRLELLNDALDPLFTEIPDGIELFDRGISQGDTPRLWIDLVAHVAMGRDKRTYRFVQDTSFGRKVLAESVESDKIVAAITRYVARRLVERERALAAGPNAMFPQARWGGYSLCRRRLSPAVQAFLFCLIIGIAVLLAAAWWLALSS